MRVAFHDRDDETRRLHRFLRNATAELAVVYGRRRCGKSTLLQRVLEPQHFYFQADQRETPLQLESLAAELSRRLTDFDKVRYRTWDELLASLYARADRRIHVCVDEFPYLAQADPALPSILQRYIDRQAGRIAWILCGSSQRMMQGMVMDRTAPLYGRAREVLKIEPLSAGWVMPALALDSTDAIRAYATWGGIPRYWELASEYEGQDEALEDLVWNPRGVLHGEPGRLLLDDLRSAVQPYSILSLIGSGCHRPAEISARMVKPLSSLARPLAQLCELGYVRRDVPFGEDPKKTRRALYRLNDPFLRFYFRFMLPYESSLAQGMTHEAVHDWQRDRQGFFGACWEELCRASVPWIPGFDPPYGAGSAWSPTGGKQADVDVVALSLDRKSLLLGECKWSDRKRQFDLDAIDRRLRQTGERIPAARGKRIVTSCWLGGTAQTTGRIDRLLTPDDVMVALTR
ncbi:MAG: ATP-binding protein [Spirochaetaceae bacterium]|nr:ATP-binding protein [Spirochaetaceae bacterium]